jgi:hypothetical protein
MLQDRDDITGNNPFNLAADTPSTFICALFQKGNSARIKVQTEWRPPLARPCEQGPAGHKFRADHFGRVLDAVERAPVNEVRLGWCATGFVWLTKHGLTEPHSRRKFKTTLQGTFPDFSKPFNVAQLLDAVASMLTQPANPQAGSPPQGPS